MVPVDSGVLPSSCVFLLFPKRRGKTTSSGRCSHTSGSSYTKAASRFLFLFGGGRLLHNVQSLILRNPTEDSAIRLAISSLKVFPNIRPAVFSIWRPNCRLVSRSLLPLLRFGFGWRLLPNGRLFEVLRPAFSLVWFFLKMRTLPRATPVRLVIPLRVAANFIWVLSSGRPRRPAAG
jgi:hypothetical protein